MYNIGFTVGVFDLFHAGHVSFLRQAKAQCTYLIVGICSDELVVQLKNRQPIFCEQDRLEILSSVKFVNHSFIKISPDKYNDWKKYHFDAVFHGDQEAKSRFHEIESRKKLVPMGVIFIYFNRDYRISTSKYLEKIKSDER